MGDIWDQILGHGEALGIMPCSFASLDKVRIEAGLLFYGYDMTEENTPWEVGLGFTVSTSKADFRGKDALIAAKDQQKIQNVSLVIDHPGGWQTQYCHLRRGSVSVAKGDEVTRGQRLGYVGHSGMAEFPHLHLSVRRGAKVVDPFVGPDGDATACEAGPAPLWTAEALRQLAPPLTAVYNAGFAPTRPKPAAVRKGLYHAPALSRRAPALILWAEIFWVRPGDTARLRILGPDGGVVAEHSNVLPKRQARRMIFAGRKKPGLFWPAGEYTGEVVVERLSGDGRTRRFVARRSVVLKD